MSFLDLEKLSAPISADSPCGENLEYDPTYLQLEEYAFGTASQELGNAHLEGVEPDARKLKESCLALLGKTHDLQVGVYLSLSGLSLQGLKGFSECIDLLSVYVRDYWETVWPQLDPMDDNDPLERLNILSALSPPMGAYEDQYKFSQLVQDVNLCDSRQMGRYSLRDILISTGELEPGERKKVDISLIKAAFMDTDASVLEETLVHTKRIIESLHAIGGFVQETTDSSIDFSRLTGVLSPIITFVENALAGRGGQDTSEEATETDTPAEPTMNAAPTTAVSATGVGIGGLTSITSRDDVLVVLEKVCAYYEANEPASPVPLLLRRAKKMATMNFLQIIDEVSPMAKDQALNVFGRQSIAPPVMVEEPPPEPTNETKGTTSNSEW